MSKIDFSDFIKTIDEPWLPQDIAYVNDTCLRMAKIHGVYDWHVHRSEDEFFYVIKGSIFIDLEKQSVELKEQQGYLVRRGVKHRSRSDKPAWVLLIEPTATKTRGEANVKK